MARAYVSYGAKETNGLRLGERLMKTWVEQTKVLRLLMTPGCPCCPGSRFSSSIFAGERWKTDIKNITGGQVARAVVRSNIERSVLLKA